MSFVKSYGVAFPYYRVEDAVLHAKGKNNSFRAVCYSDEDIITLSFQAAKECLSENNDSIDAIFFATSTPVFHNRYHATYLADLLGLKTSVTGLDFINTERCGTDALIMANELVNCGKHTNLLVIAAAVDFPGIGEELFSNKGHAACAILLNNTDGIAKISESFSVSAFMPEEFSYKNNFIRQDARYSRDEGFKQNMLQVLDKLKENSRTIDKIILNSKYSKLAGPSFIKSGYAENQFSKDKLTSKIGNTGSAHALLQLIHEIESGTKNILVIDYTNGSNTIYIESIKEINRKFLQDKLIISQNIVSYQDYLLLRKEGNFNSVKYKNRDMFSSEMMNEREKESFIHLLGMKCNECGTNYIIKTARCKKCKAETFKPVKLSDTGKVYSFTREHYFPVSFPPVTMLVIDLDGGGRVTVQQTDTMYPENNTIKIGSEVKLVLRKMIEHDQKPNYFLKAIALS